MIGSTAGAPHGLLDGVVSSRIPPSLRSSTEPLRPHGASVRAAVTTAHQGLVSGTRFPHRKAVDAASVTSVVETRNCRESLSESGENSSAAASATSTGKIKRVFLLDVNPICYDGARPNLHSFARWLSLFFAQVSLRDPVIAVLDGDNGNDYRKRLLPSYKAHRRKLSAGGPAGLSFTSQMCSGIAMCRSVVKVNGYEADDIVATLADQAIQRGLRVVIASPDKDFKQLISEDVQIVMPADGVPGIQQFVPSFGRKTAVRLLKKHGSLENLLNTAAVRTVGKQYAQDALNKYADYLRRNYEVLSLRRDADIHLQEEWLCERQVFNDSTAVSDFVKLLDRFQQPSRRYVPSR
ncbi:unnamed protein product [Spirodela intermedia]|uniref:5'-3' exonuclease domain-containing protein n=1 Tax=Spirodela intermedia TaxID=51605 RepID=A0A7I8JBX0_SPIIN|nr:unnamed protein product [Spirodela intermedia]CAA6667698.1 unnamed protein product [Spirodela intermedia]